MIISTKKGTPKEELEKIVDKFEKQGLDVTLITGKDYNVFGLVGDTTKIDERDVLANPWIDNVTRVSAPYKRANRLFHPADSVIDCGGVKIGRGASPSPSRPAVPRSSAAALTSPAPLPTRSRVWKPRASSTWSRPARPPECPSFPS